ncbi:hypothetical protein DPEC_G00097260 [Dallia pectoralis]|uniref:Uncharacterized protein n=1 Tax=Dallia pectoralis TaxID=75939 RepID=A0ACC2GVX8_DALPE|nr:hypothetical protein DPEC_G00097260 [Dallia pectoralis]
MLYLCPKSSILTNSDKSGPFGLHRGVRQEDPLSPLLFDVALEPIALGIRSHPGIEGIKTGEIESRASNIPLCVLVLHLRIHSPSQWLSFDIAPDPELTLFACSENDTTSTNAWHGGRKENDSPGLEISHSSLILKMAQRND